MMPKTTMNCLRLIGSGLLLVQSVAVATDVQQKPALKEVFKDKFLVGAALNPGQFTGANARSAAIVAKHFNTITPENVLKWGPVHPQEATYVFELPDRYVEFGEKHGMKIIGHTLVWHSQTPDWVFQQDGKPVDRETLLARMRSHIQTVVGRYKGRITGWDVVNEAVEEDGSMRQSPWFKIIGPDYVLKAFQFAHEADPQAELYYNDYSIENTPKRKGAIKLIKELQAAGIPVAAVGIQGHYKLDWPKPGLLQETLDDFSKLGIKCMITELDVDVLPSRRSGSAEVSLREGLTPESNRYVSGLPEKVNRQLTERYSDIFSVLVKNEDKITRVTFWGVTDAESWLNNWPVRGRVNYPLLFDREGNPKAAFDAVVKTAR